MEEPEELNLMFDASLSDIAEDESKEPGGVTIPIHQILSVFKAENESRGSSGPDPPLVRRSDLIFCEIVLLS